MTVLDFNPPTATPINSRINELLDAAALLEEKEERRTYLGASGIGSACMRKVQFDWQRVSEFPARTKRIFKRGHDSEEKIATQLRLAGFELERGTEACGFSVVDGKFQGHCDGILRDGPDIDAFGYPRLWENKCLGASGFNKIAKYGLRKDYPYYYDQVMLYQAYLGFDENPALFTVENADKCEILALLVPFDADAAQAASDRAVAIINATDVGELMPRIANEPTDFRCKMCNHREFCWSLPS